MRKFSLLVLALALLATVASADPIHYGFPPPGGISYSLVGNAANPGGATFQFWGMDPSQYGQLYWGTYNVDMYSTQTGPLGPSFFAGQVGPTTYQFMFAAPIFVQTANYGMLGLQGRFLLTTQSFMVPVPGYGVSPWAMPVNGPFWANMQFELMSLGFPEVGGFNGWMAADTLWNALRTNPQFQLHTDVWNQFAWTDAPPPKPTIPEPASLTLLGTGMMGAAAWVRRRARR